MAAVTSTPPLSPAALDTARAVLEQSVIDQKVPRPRLGDWWQEVLGSFFAFLGRVLNLDSATVRTLMFTVAWAVIAVAVVALLWLAWSWWRGRQSAAEAELVVLASPPARVGLNERDHSRVLAQALDAGNVPAALEAMWLLIAARIGRLASAEAAMRRLVASKEWTPRLLLAEAGSLRRALAVPLRELERHTYGSTTATIAQLRLLWAQLEQVVPAASTERETV